MASSFFGGTKVRKHSQFHEKLRNFLVSKSASVKQSCAFFSITALADSDFGLISSFHAVLD